MIQRTNTAYKTGQIAESITAWILRLKGYRIEKRRYRTPVGEIDILASKGDLLVVVEVKKRQQLNIALESLTSTQQRRLINAGAWVLARSKKEQIRFDGFFFAPWAWPIHLKNILSN